MATSRRTFGAIRWTAASALIRGGLQIVQLAILARLLQPVHFGLVASASVVLNFGSIFSDLGLNSAYLQSRQVTQLQRSSMYWLNIGVGGLITISIAALSPFIASALGDARITPILILSSTIFLFGSLGQQLRVDAEKRLDFRKVAIIEMASGGLGFAAAVTAAVGGAGAYSLVVGTALSALSTACFNWIFLADGWRPTLRFRLADVRPFLAFGISMVGNSIVGQISASADLIIGGRMLRSNDFGLYAVPRNFMLQIQMLINPVVTRVGFPLISEIQLDTARVRSVYGRMLGLLVSVNAPIYLGLLVFAAPCSYILFGPRWAYSENVVRMLAAWGLIRCTMNPLGSLIFGLGRPALALVWNVGQILFLLPVLWISAHWNGPGLAGGLLAFTILVVVPSWRWLIFPLCDMPLLELLEKILKPVALTALSLVPSALATAKISHPVIHLILAGCLFVPVHLALNLAFNREAFDSLLGLVGRRQIRANSQ